MKTFDQPRTFKLNFAFLQSSEMMFTVWDNGQICICDEIIVDADLTFTCHDENDLFLVESYNEHGLTLFTEVEYKIKSCVFGQSITMLLNRADAIEYLASVYNKETITISARLDSDYEWDANPSQQIKNVSITKLTK